VGDMTGSGCERLLYFAVAFPGLHDVIRICSRPTCHPAILSFLWPWKTNSGLIWLDWVAVSGSDSPARGSPSYWVTVLSRRGARHRWSFR
jgi:hypothetical protein